MRAPGTPLRWPAGWADPAALTLLRDTGIDTLLIGNSDEFEPVRARAEQMGLRVVHPDVPPDGVTIIKGQWAGVKRSRSGADAGAGPTGVPWVDSNGWAIRLAAAMHPGQQAWVEAEPPKDRLIVGTSGYLTAIADCAAFGGRWIVALDETLETGIPIRAPIAMVSWAAITRATSFFAAHPAWDQMAPVAGVGVLSDFSGGNEFFNQELLNLLTRAGQHVVALRKESVTPAAVRGLRAVLYADAEPPSAGMRKTMVDYAQGGGLLITTPHWGDVPGTAGSEQHPRFQVWQAGRGRMARSVGTPSDPYLMANDAVVLVSHRYDLVRFWNAGACGSSYISSADRKQAVVQVLFYADRGPDAATVRIAGPYRSVKASTMDSPALKVESLVQRDGIEVHLPQVSQYVALELSA